MLIILLRVFGLLTIFGHECVYSQTINTGPHKYTRASICADVTYGQVLTEAAENGMIACAIGCNVAKMCASFVYNEDTTTCTLNRDVLDMTSMPSVCASYMVTYAEKYIQEGTKAGCTFPVSNVRLCDGNGAGLSSQSFGRIEVYRSSTEGWGTVCDDYWGDGHAPSYEANNAAVVCRMFGYTSGSVHELPTPYPGVEPTIMDNVMCSGSETSLLHCSYITEDNCGHDEDVFVFCY